MASTPHFACCPGSLTPDTAIFCTEPFRIPSAGRVDVCCFDKTGTITAEDLVLEGIAGVEYVPKSLHPVCSMLAANAWRSYSPKDGLRLVDVKETGRTTTLCLAAAHALVKLDDGTIVGDPMEKTTLEALDWKLGAGTRFPAPSLTSDY